MNFRRYSTERRSLTDLGKYGRLQERMVRTPLESKSASKLLTDSACVFRGLWKAVRISSFHEQRPLSIWFIHANTNRKDPFNSIIQPGGS
jgi:hypothetical protein